MESSRRTYEMATQRLVTFLDEVTSALQATSPQHRKLVESTKAEVSRVARRAQRASANKRLSLDSASTLISRAESMPGLNFDSGLTGSQLSLCSSSLSSGHALFDGPPQSSTPSRASRSGAHGGVGARVQRSQSTQSKRNKTKEKKASIHHEVEHMARARRCPEPIAPHTQSFADGSQF